MVEIHSKQELVVVSFRKRLKLGVVTSDMKLAMKSCFISKSSQVIRASTMLSRYMAQYQYN